MKLSLMTFTMALDGLKKILDAPLLTRMIRNSGFHEADIMELEFQVYGEEKLLSELKQNNECGASSASICIVKPNERICHRFSIQ
ncbi:MAG: hypothetical protein IKH30_13080 [Clostridia bacterium]|nr:hypothetical protein [Clostridia bacterium]